MTPLELWTLGWAISFIFIGIETTILRESLVSFFIASILAFIIWPVELPFQLYRAFKRM